MSDMRTWNKTIVTELISLYKSYPCLWKVKSDEYKNKTCREEAYNVLIDFCKRKGIEEANRDYVVKKLQSLKRSFRKEMKKVTESQRRGTGTYKSSLWYFDKLLFTKDQDPQTDTSRMLNYAEDVKDEVLSSDDENHRLEEEEEPNKFTKIPQTKDQKREKKRLAERKRMENIRKDPDKYALWKLKMQKTYLKKKREGKIVSIQNLTTKQQKIARKKSRESSRRWNAKKKLKECDIHSEEEIIDECPTENTEVIDPLDSELLSTPNVSIIPKSPEIPSSSQSDEALIEMDTEPYFSRNKRKFVPICRREVSADSLSANVKKLSEFDITGMNVANKLAKMDPLQAIYAESVINEVLTQGLLNKLSEDTGLSANHCERRTFSRTCENQIPVANVPSPVQEEESGDIKPFIS